jgi:putative SOS response-associated peptidase YedK
MPVILPRKAWGKWLGEEPTRKDDRQLLLNPFPAARMRRGRLTAITVAIATQRVEELGR